MKLGRVCKVQGGFAFKSESFVDEPNGVPVIKIGDLQNGRVTVDEKKVESQRAFFKIEAFKNFI